MSSLKLSLATYLLGRQDLPGLPAVEFDRPRTIEGIVCRNRNDARQGIRSKIGDRVFFDRRPQDIKDHTAIVLQTLTATPDYGLAGQVDGSNELLMIHAFARTGDAGRRAQAVGDLLSLAISGYVGDYWGSTYIGECLVESQQSDSEPPPDGTDDWLFTRRLDVSVLFRDESAAGYPYEVFQAFLTWGLNPGESPELRLSAATSVVPGGRTLVDVAWDIRTGGPTGPIVLSFNGSPQLSPGAAGVTGTSLAPSIDRATYGLSSVFVHVTLTLTDNTGGQVTISEGRNE